MDTVETIYTEDKKRRARIEYDDDSSACDPRDDDELVEIVTGDLRRWNVRTEGATFQHVFDRFNEEGRASLFRRWLKVFHDIEAQPVYLMDHSSVALSTGDFGDPWDSGQVGWAYINPAAEAWEGMEPAKILSGFVKTLGEWMNGEVYGYIVEKRVTAHTTYDDDEVEDLDSEEWIEEDDTCWGIIGYEWAVQEAKMALGLPTEDIEKEA